MKPIQMKFMMKKLMTITEIITLLKSAWFPNHRKYRLQILTAQIEDLNEDCVKISRSYLLYFPRDKPSKSVTDRPDRFIILNDRASPEMVIKIYLHFFPYMTDNRNFVRFAHS